MRFHCQTAGSLLTSQDPENNLARVALQALAAVLGGCQSLHTNSYDEAIGLPGEHSAQLAAATQHILAHETGIADTADPLGGAYAIEAITDKLEAEARAILAEIDALGGAAKAVASGFYQRRIAEAAFEYQRGVESGERSIVGVNCYRTAGEFDAENSIQPMRPEMENEARDSVAHVRASRDQTAVHAALAELDCAARANPNRMPAILKGARARCTLGEICGVLRKVYGEH